MEGLILPMQYFGIAQKMILIILNNGKYKCSIHILSFFSAKRLESDKKIIVETAQQNKWTILEGHTERDFQLNDLANIRLL